VKRLKTVANVSILIARDPSANQWFFFDLHQRMQCAGRFQCAVLPSGEHR